MEHLKIENLNTDSTSFHGETIAASVQVMKRVLGEITYEDNTGTDKVNFEWCRQTESKNVFTVYDWKNYRALSETEVVCWHIGAYNKEISLNAYEEILSAISKLVAASVVKLRNPF